MAPGYVADEPTSSTTGSLSSSDTPAYDRSTGASVPTLRTQTPILQKDLSDSVLLETEKWSPYRNLLVFLSTVLLWHRPIPFAVLCVVTHVFLWVTAKALLKWNAWFFLGTVLVILFCVDFICATRNITWDTFLRMFPRDNNERVSYNEIMQQYVTAKKFGKAQWGHAMQFRGEQPVQFLITGMFFTFLTCFFLSFFNLFATVYLLTFTVLLTPGLWHNNALHRAYHHLAPLVTEMYNAANENLADLVSPQHPEGAASPDVPAPSQEVRPAKPRVERTISFRRPPVPKSQRGPQMQSQSARGSVNQAYMNAIRPSLETIPSASSSRPSYLDTHETRKRTM